MNKSAQGETSEDVWMKHGDDCGNYFRVWLFWFNWNGGASQRATGYKGGAQSASADAAGGVQVLQGEEAAGSELLFVFFLQAFPAGLSAAVLPHSGTLTAVHPQ